MTRPAAKFLFWECRCLRINAVTLETCKCGKPRPGKATGTHTMADDCVEIPSATPYIDACIARTPKRPPRPATGHCRPNCHRALNKTEARAYDRLCQWYGQVWGHAMRMPLSDGQWYEPDFVAWRGTTPVAYEVKGTHAGKHIAWSERGIEKFKRARAEHPELEMRLLVWDGNEWREE